MIDMSSSDFELNALFSSFREIEEGVYFKHYGFEIPASAETTEGEGSSTFGDFEAKALLWHKQPEDNADCLALKLIIEGITGNDSQNQMDIRQECIERGLFHADSGASLDDVIEMLKLNASGNGKAKWQVDVMANCALSELAEAVDSRDEVICYVNRMQMDYEGELSYPGQNADTLVHAIGISFHNDEGDYVILNDVSRDDGAGRKIPLDRFLKAWATGDNTIITVARR